MHGRIPRSYFDIPMSKRASTMQFTSESVEVLVEQFTKLPTVGTKTARRLANYVLKMPREEVEPLAEALMAVKEEVQRCSTCYVVADEDPCPICISEKRDQTTICVVEESNDLMAIERTGEYRGVYHVLGGVISPLDGVGPDDLRVHELAARIDPSFEETATVEGGEEASPVSNGAPEGTAGETDNGDSESGDPESPVEEIILAVNPNVEGDTTAYYVSQLLEPFDVRVTRIARGLPIGGDLEYADEATLSRALEGRGHVE